MDLQDERSHWGRAMDEELTAVTAHWLLGRLAVLHSTATHLQHRPDVDRETAELLLARSREVMGEMQRALEDLARGLPPTEIEFRRPLSPV